MEYEKLQILKVSNCFKSEFTHVGHVQNLPKVLISWNVSENVTEMASNHVTCA